MSAPPRATSVGKDLLDLRNCFEGDGGLSVRRKKRLRRLPRVEVNSQPPLSLRVFQRGNSPKRRSFAGKKRSLPLAFSGAGSIEKRLP